MIKKLRRRLIVVTSLSLLAVLTVIVSAINVINYHSVVREADEILALLSENQGRFPQREQPPVPVEPPQKSPDPKPRHDRLNDSPELAFESRFFTVQLNSKGKVTQIDLSRIAAVNEKTAVSMAKDIPEDKKHGFYNSYRFIQTVSEDGRQLIFLDRSGALQQFYRFLFAGILISLLGLGAVLIIIFLVSGKIIRPITESYEKQKQFITDAGHELKTPLTVIDADVEVLEMESGENEWLTDIRKQTQQLSALTHDLILLSRMEEETVPEIDFPLSEVVQETADSFLSRAKTRNQTLSTDIAPLLSLCGNESALRQLVSILLDNALKYAPDGAHIQFHLASRGKQIVLTVQNPVTHPLSAEDLSHLFDRFYRADKSRNREKGGYGIGLSLAQAIATAHKGKISVSQSDCIITFIVIFG